MTGLNNMGYVLKVKLGFTKITALLTNSSYWELIEQSKAKKKPLYYCFVDFKKEFDIMPREMLWQMLASFRVEGRFLRCLQAMYAKDIVRINHPSKGVTSSSSANKV
jgi:hypothetical protein